MLLRTVPGADCLDLVFAKAVKAAVPVETVKAEDTEQESNTIMEQQCFVAEFRMRYLIGLWGKQSSPPMIAPNK